MLEKVKEPDFTVIEQKNAFELRKYPEILIAEVTVQGTQKQAANAGFRLLADYIFGNNTAQQKIAMTAPVSQTVVSEKIAMTAPVMQQGSNDNWVIGFVMPSEYNLDTLPQPNNPQVTIRTQAPKYVAVARFKGANYSADFLDQQENALRQWVRTRNIAILDDATPVLARYNPPIIPAFMRRNELMLDAMRLE